MNEAQLNKILTLLDQVKTDEEYIALFRQHLIASQQFEALSEALTPDQQRIIREYIRTLSLMRKYEN